MDQTTHTPRHRLDRAYLLGRPNLLTPNGDFDSLAIDPPPVHPSGIVAGRHRLTDREVVRRLWDRTSEAGSTTLAAATAFWMVTALLGMVAGFFHLAARCVA